MFVYSSITFNQKLKFYSNSKNRPIFHLFNPNFTYVHPYPNKLTYNPMNDVGILLK
jgi:hypothetical protein